MADTEHHEDGDDMLDASDAEEEIVQDDDDDDGGDQPMDSDDAEADAEISLQNDSIAHFDRHSDSLFCVAAHPLHAHVVATGSGDDSAYVFSSAPPSTPLPQSYESNPSAGPRASLAPIVRLGGHSDSVSAVAFTLPDGDFVLTAGLDGRLRAYGVAPSGPDGPLSAACYEPLAEAHEVEEIAWLAACPLPSRANVVALGASDGSVWAYDLSSGQLLLLQSYHQHTTPCTAGAWSPSARALLATVSEEGSLRVFDPLGVVADGGARTAAPGQAVVTLTGADQRFAVEGGLYSVAIAPSGNVAAVGGAGGRIRVVGLPTGQIIAALQAQADGIETLAFSPAGLLAAGSVDGSVALFDAARKFAVRKQWAAHEDLAVVQVAFAGAGPTAGKRTAAPAATAAGSVLFSAGLDGVLRKWDARGTMLAEWRGHRGGGEGGGILAFALADGRAVTAGDDGVALVFDVSGKA